MNNLTPAEFAEQAQVSLKSIYGYLKAGKIQSVKNNFSGRITIPEAELSKILAPSTVRVPGVKKPNTHRGEAFTAPPAQDGPAPIKTLLLAGLEAKHGKEAAQKVSAEWTPGIDQGVDLLLKMPGGIDQEKLKRVVAILPPETLQYPPALWVIQTLAAAQGPVLPKKAVVALAPPSAEMEVKDELPVAPDTQVHLRTIQQKPSEPPKRASKALKVLLPPVGEEGLCATCGIKDGHASGCPVGMEELTEVHGTTKPRVSSPRAEAAQQKALYERAQRMTVDPLAGLPDGWQPCEDESCELPYHTNVQVPNIAGLVMGHTQRDLDRAAQTAESVARGVMRRLGPPPAPTAPPLSQLPPPEAETLAKPARKASGKKKPRKAPAVS